MSGRRARCLAGALGTLLALAPCAAPALARDLVVSSFDGTQLQASFFPAAGLQPGQQAPTVLVGHGWAGRRDVDPESKTSTQTGSVGLGPLRHAGFNVMTWDARGFNHSGGLVEIDGPDAEGRDVQALVSAVAQQPEALLDAPGDPRVAIHGASYAGGIALIGAAVDDRVDAIVPAIAWHSLTSALLPDASFKEGWASALLAAAKGGSLTSALGAPPPPGAIPARLDPRITSAFASEQQHGTISASDLAWFRSRGPGALVKRIHVPTYLLQGTVDTLFPLREAIANYRILRADHVPVAMRWFCGGHGICSTPPGDTRAIQTSVIAWLERYLKRDASVKTGPRFTWVMDDGSMRSAPDWPPRRAGMLRGRGSTGKIALSPKVKPPGLFISAQRARRAYEIPLAPPRRGADAVGAVRVRLTYRARARGGRRTWIYGQLIDREALGVVGNQAAPIPLVLDGRRHTVTRSLAVVATRASRRSRYAVQLLPVTSAFARQRVRGTVSVLRASASLPLVRP